jgi:hypothetical protein
MHGQRRSVKKSGAGQWSRRSSGGDGAVELPVATAPLSIRLGIEVGQLGSGKPHICALTPPHIYDAARQGPTSRVIGERSKMVRGV